MKLSIIVPVYNVQEYIVKCIQSLLSQDSNDYEIIVVNDGTKDKSIELLEKSFDNNKLKIFNQKNVGLSETRNNGLNFANGEYVWFFDSDDWVSENVLSQILTYLSNIDLLYFTSYFTETESSSKVTKLVNNHIKGKELSFHEYFHGAPFYIYKKNFLKKNGLKFMKGIYHEDSLFTPQVLYLSNKIKAYHSPVYHRLIRENSITQTINPKRCYDLQYVILSHHNFCLQFIKNKKERYQWGHCIADCINNLLFQTTMMNQDVRINTNKFFSENKYLYVYLCHSSKIRTRLLGYLWMFLRIPLFDLYNFLQKFRYR